VPHPWSTSRTVNFARKGLLLEKPFNIVTLKELVAARVRAAAPTVEG